MQDVQMNDTIVANNMKRKPSQPLQSDIDKIQIHSVNTRITFSNEENSFINIKWTIISDALNALSTQWEFLAFGTNHTTAIISVFTQQVFDTFKNDIKEVVDDNKVVYGINIEELKPNAKRGIIFNKFLIPFTDDEIIKILSPQGIEDVYRIQKIDAKTNKKCYTGSIIINVSSNTTLSSVTIGNIQIPINQLAPRPMICDRCGLLGHTSKKCRRADTDLCPKCFFSHDNSIECNKHCKNCNESHFSNDKRCNVLKREVQILKVKELHSINYFDAKKIVENTFGDIEEAIDNKDNEENTDRIKLLIEDKRKLSAELKKQRDLCENQSEEIRHLKHEIPAIKEKFLKYKEENDAKVKELQEMLEQEIVKNSEEVTSLTKENIELKNKNNSLAKKANALQTKNCNLERQEKETQSLFEEFCKMSEVSDKFSDYCKKKNVLNHPFLKTSSTRTTSRDRSSIK